MNENYIKLTNAVYKLLEFFPESDPLKNRAKDKALVIMSALGGSALGGDNLVSTNEVRHLQGWATLADTFEIKKNKAQLLEDIEILLGYLWIAKTQKWLNSVNYIIIANEYEKIKKDSGLVIAPVIEMTKELPGILDKSVAIISEKFDEDLVGEINIEPELTDDPELDDKEGDILNDTNVDLPIQTGRQKMILEYLGKNDKAQVMDLQKVLPDITKRTIRRDLDELLEAGKIVRLGDFNQVFYKLNG